MPSRLLSDEWIAAVNDLDAPVAAAVRLGVAIADAEHPEGRIAATFDTTMGRLTVTRASGATADVHVATDYGTALEIVRSTEAATALAAFLAGRILVQGGVMSLIALGNEILRGPIAGRVQAVTA